MLLAAFTVAWALDCPQQLTREDLVAKVDEAEGAWANLETEQFRDRMNELNGLLVPCIGDRIPPDAAARVHRLMSLQQLELGDEAAAAAAWLAAPRIDPSIVLPDSWLPSTHPLRSVEPLKPKIHRVAEPRDGALAFDGTPGLGRPIGVPTLFQRFDAAGVAQLTRYVGADEPLPEYRGVPKIRRRLVGGAVGLGVAGLATWTGSWVGYRSLLAAARDPAVSAADLDRRRANVNMTYAVGAGFLGGAIGVGVGAVAVGPR